MVESIGEQSSRTKGPTDARKQAGHNCLSSQINPISYAETCKDSRWDTVVHDIGVCLMFPDPRI